MPEWLTYAQAGARFGMSADALRMRARRLGWRTQPGNDGRALVLVPDDADVQHRERSPERRAPEHSAEQGEVARLTVLLTAADARAEKANLRADRAEQRADAAIVRADTADADRRAAQDRADAAEGRAVRAEDRATELRERLDAAELARRQAEEVAELARSQASHAHQAAAELRQAEADRKARGLLARLRAAVRGE